MSPVTTTKGSGPYVELFLKGALTLELKSKMLRLFCYNIFALPCYLTKNCQAVKNMKIFRGNSTDGGLVEK